MRSILAGIETEYGLAVEGRGAAEQLDDSVAFVRSYPGLCHAGWNYRHESPRADLRGFTVERLTVDPDDLQFSKPEDFQRKDSDVRSDRVLPNGARLYNDHGHPEYSTPECLSLDELVRQDLGGELAMLRTKHAFEEATGKAVRLYKNNTDYHGASYGTHESYLVSRSIGFDKLYAALVPILLCRQILTGAGKVGSENGKSSNYQLTQRAEFFSEKASVDTLFKRPLFNTRDEPHADPEAYVRVHVIPGDANRIPSCTKLKVGLIKLAISCIEAGAPSEWAIPDPARAFRELSQDESGSYEISLEKGKTNAFEILESYCAAAGALVEPNEDLTWTIKQTRRLVESLRGDKVYASRHIDWLAKKNMLDSLQEEGGSLLLHELRSYELEYHNVDPEESLFEALIQMGRVEGFHPDPTVLESACEPTRALARGIAVRNFPGQLKSACWRSLVLEVEPGVAREVELYPDRSYDETLREISDVESFIQALT